MGANSAKALSPELTNRFTIVRSLEGLDIYFLEENNTQRECLLRQMRFSQKNDFERVLGILEERRKMPPFQYITPLRELLTLTDQQYCLSKHKVMAIFDYPHRSLEEQLLERANMKRKFQQRELWSIIASCILGLSFLQKNGITHQCLRSDQILLGVDGSIQIADPFCSAEGTNYEILLDNKHIGHLYPSPEMCQALSERYESPPRNFNFFRSDVFTVGMIILEVGLFQSQDDCYYSNKTCINWEKIKRNLLLFEEVYGRDMRAVVELLLVANFKQRPDWVEMEQVIKKSNSNTVQVVTIETIEQQKPKSDIRDQKTGALPYQKQSFVNQLGPSINPSTPMQNKPTMPLSAHSTPINKFQGAESNITENQQLLHYTFMNATQGSSNNSISQSGVDCIVPIQPAPNLMMVRPKFNLGQKPQDNYTATTKVDDNLIEVEDQYGTHWQSKCSMKKSATKVNVPYVEAFSHGNMGGGGYQFQQFSNPISSTAIYSTKNSNPLKNQTVNIMPSLNQAFVPNKNIYQTNRIGDSNFLNYQTNPSAFKAPIANTPTSGRQYPGYTFGAQNQQFGSFSNKFTMPEFKMPQFGNKFGQSPATSTNSSLGNVNTSLALGPGQNKFGLQGASGLPTNFSSNDFSNKTLGNIGVKNYTANRSFQSSSFQDIGSLAGNHGLTDFSKLGVVTNFKRTPKNSTTAPSNEFNSKSPNLPDYPLLNTKLPSEQIGVNMQNNFNLIQPSSHQKSISLSKGILNDDKFQGIGKTNNFQQPYNPQFLKPLAPSRITAPAVDFGRVIKPPQSPVLDLLNLKPYEKQATSSTDPSSNSGVSSAGFNLRSQQMMYQQGTTKPAASNSSQQPSQNSNAFTDYSQFARISSPSVSSNFDNTFTTKVGSGSTITQPSVVNQYDRPQFATSIAESIQGNFIIADQNEQKISRGKQNIVYNQATNQQSDLTSSDDLKSNPQLTMTFQPYRLTTRSSVQNVNQSNQRFTADIDNKNNPLLSSSTQNMTQSANFGQAQRTSEVPKPLDTKISTNTEPITSISQSKQLQHLNHSYAEKKNELTTFVIQSFKNGSRYEGEKVNDMKHGKGKFYYQDGGLYDGDWRTNRMEGFGKLYYQTGKLAYKGDWKKDEFHGHGVLYNQFPQKTEEILNCQNFFDIQQYWTEFQGEFVHDSKDGKGTFYFSNGDYFEGVFKKDVICGPGAFYSHNGEIIKGIWQNNKLEQRQN